MASRVPDRRLPVACATGEPSLRLRSGGLGDVGNVGAVNAEVVQLAVRVAGQFAHDIPIDIAGAEVAAKERQFHVCLHSALWALRLSAAQECSSVSST